MHESQHFSLQVLCTGSTYAECAAANGFLSAGWVRGEGRSLSVLNLKPYVETLFHCFVVLLSFLPSMYSEFAAKVAGKPRELARDAGQTEKVTRLFYWL